MERKIIDLKNMPNFNIEVRNGIDSVSTGKVFLMKCATTGVKLYPTCYQHGAMNKVTKEGIWRCLMCNVGCWEKTKTIR